MAEESLTKVVVAVRTPTVQPEEGYGHQAIPSTDTTPTANREILQVKTLLDVPGGVFHAPTASIRFDEPSPVVCHVTFRQDIDRSCAKCHESHDAPATKAISCFVERCLPGRPAPIGADCHGAHKIEGSATTKKLP